MFGDRRLNLKTVARSVGSALVVRENEESLPSTFHYLPEPCGAVPRSIGGSGFVARSIPDELKDNKITLVPLFALFGRDETLLLEIVDSSGMTVRQFVEEVLCNSFAELWLNLSISQGFLIEAHGQDLLLAFSGGFAQWRGWYYRDFEGMQIDWALRRQLGLSMPPTMPADWRWFNTPATFGFRQSQLTWYKWYISLFNYVDLVLQDMNDVLSEWQASRGLLDGGFAENELTAIFSCAIRRVLAQSYGVSSLDIYNIGEEPKRFSIFLFNVRRELLRRQV